MLLGAAWRRFSSRGIRATGLISTTVLLCTAGGSFVIPAAAAPYPPTAPCALSWARTSVREPLLVGNGYDTNEPVTVTLYPQARRLGSYSTNASGAFAAPIDVPSTAASWVTASSPHRSCSVTPPSGGGTGSQPSAPTSTTAPYPPSAPTSTTAPYPPSAPTSTTGPYPPTAPTGPYPPNGPATGTTSGPSTGPGGSTAPTTGSTSSSSSTGPSRPTSQPPTSPSNADSRRASTLGLPLSIIVTIAALLLLAGGLGVLFLTRRAG